VLLGRVGDLDVAMGGGVKVTETARGVKERGNGGDLRGSMDSFSNDGCFTCFNSLSVEDEKVDAYCERKRGRGVEVISNTPDFDVDTLSIQIKKKKKEK
jgi:hypothetical protein